MDGFIQMLPAPLRQFSTHIDFQGQKLAERIMHVILVTAGIVGFFIGFYTQQLSHTVYTVLGASAFTALVILPPWPFLRRHPIKWLPNPGEAGEKKAEAKNENKKRK